MKSHIPSGHAVIFMETDFSEVRPFDEESLTSVQKECYSQLSETEKGKVQEGYGTVISDLQSGRKICEFNMEYYKPPKEALDRFARAILPEIQEYFSKEENRKKYEEEKNKN